jgi:hypothetical protein
MHESETPATAIPDCRATVSETAPRTGSYPRGTIDVCEFPYQKSEFHSAPKMFAKLFVVASYSGVSHASQLLNPLLTLSQTVPNAVHGHPHARPKQAALPPSVINVGPSGTIVIPKGQRYYINS